MASSRIFFFGSKSRFSLIAGRRNKNLMLHIYSERFEKWDAAIEMIYDLHDFTILLWQSNTPTISHNKTKKKKKKKWDLLGS